MKYLKQFLIILVISYAGELLKYVLPLPIPASIYGMVILLVGLLTGWIALDAVKDVGKFLIEIMPVMFIPAGVGLMSSWGILKPLILPVSIITVVTITAIVINHQIITVVIQIIINQAVISRAMVEETQSQRARNHHLNQKQRNHPHHLIMVQQVQQL